MTRSEKGKQIISKIPLNNILTETDGPFVKENGQTILPGNVTSIIKYLSQIHNLSEEQIIKKINFFHFI